MICLFIENFRNQQMTTKNTVVELLTPVSKKGLTTETYIQANTTTEQTDDDLRKSLNPHGETQSNVGKEEESRGSADDTHVKKASDEVGTSTADLDGGEKEWGFF